MLLKFICFREDQTKDEKLLWELLKKKRKYQPPDSPFAQTGFLCTGTNNKHQKLTRGRSSIHHKPITRSCVQGLNPQTPRLDCLIPLGSTPSATTQKYLLRKRVTPWYYAKVVHNCALYEFTNAHNFSLDYIWLFTFCVGYGSSVWLSYISSEL